MFALLSAFAASGSLTGQTVGFIGGLNRSSIHGDAPEALKWGGRTGLVLGAMAEFSLTSDLHLLLQPTLTTRGSSLRAKVAGERKRVDSGSVALHYVTVPVLVKVVAAHRRTFVTSGLEFGMLAGATLKEGDTESEVEERLERFDLAVNFGFGGVVVAGRPTVTLELRYSQSLLNLANGTTTEEALPVRFRSSGFQLVAAVLLPLGDGR